MPPKKEKGNKGKGGGGPPRVPDVIGGPSGGGARFGAFYVTEEQPSGTNGGLFASGAWRTRTLNTVVLNEIGAVLSSNQFTLPAGTYELRATAPASDVHGHQARLRNITDDTTTLVGTPEWSAITLQASTPSVIVGRFTIAAAKVFEVQHRCAANSSGTEGFGLAGAFEVETYTTVWLKKVA